MNLWQQYVRPTSVVEAVTALTSAPGPALPLAGGTDILLDLQPITTDGRRAGSQLPLLHSRVGRAATDSRGRRRWPDTRSGARVRRRQGRGARHRRGGLPTSAAGHVPDWRLSGMRIYLDNAATSWPKPECVYDAVDRYQRQVGSAAGRGAYRDAVEAQRIVADARRGCAALLGVSDPTRIVFGGNGTDALNLAIHGLLRPGDHVVATVCDHNSVLRPIAAARDRQQVEATIVSCSSEGLVDPGDIRRSLRANTRLVAITHASNVTGAVQPILQIVNAVRQHEALLLVDAAQTAGHMPIDVDELGVDLLAASGHKGLLGPLGTGLLYIRSGVELLLLPMRQGGTGIDSQAETQPDRLPERYEAGNLNVPALAGLAAAARFLGERGLHSIQAHESQLCRQLVEGLSAVNGVRVYGPESLDQRTGVVSFSIEGYDPQELAAMLDATTSIQCRAGLHCAPLMHRALGTEDRGGLIRFSAGWATTTEQVEQAVNSVRAVAASA